MSVHNFPELLAHVGHNTEIASYDHSGSNLEPANVAIECMDCSMVLLDFDRDDWERSAEAQRERSIHERHVDLMAYCRLCRIEAGDQPDRLTPGSSADEDEQSAWELQQEVRNIQ